MPATDELIGIDRTRHLELDGRQRHPWGRRGALIVVTAVPVLALVGVFGQQAVVSRADSSAAVLTVNSPAHVRGGLVFTTRITVAARVPLHDMRLRLSRGWFEGMTFNGIAPQPTNETAENGSVVYDYGSVPATTFSIWVSWMTNPTNVGRHPQDITLYDGSRQLAGVHRTLTVFP